jgi:hypothetical protein
MTSSKPGTINDVHGLLRKADDSSHFFETRLVKRTPAREATRKTYPPTFERSTMEIAMTTENEWPCYTFTLSALNYINQSTSHYNMNMGLRNKSVINLIKATTKFQYKITSDQSWRCRKIVWTSGDPGPFNRAMTGHLQERSTAKEYELVNNMGTMTQTSHNTCNLAWNEPYYTSATETMEEQQNRTITSLLHGPLNTKYPSKPFYWKPSDGVITIYDETTTIPGKQQHLESEMYEDDTWQKGPGLVEYKDNIGRGGIVNQIDTDIKYQKNWHMTLIWQPDGDFSGKPLTKSDTDPKNYLECDIIHTLFFDQ